MLFSSLTSPYWYNRWIKSFFLGPKFISEMASIRSLLRGRTSNDKAKGIRSPFSTLELTINFWFGKVSVKCIISDKASFFWSSAISSKASKRKMKCYFVKSSVNAVSLSMYPLLFSESLINERMLLFGPKFLNSIKIGIVESTKSTHFFP